MHSVSKKKWVHVSTWVLCSAVWACGEEPKDTGSQASNFAPVITWTAPQDRLVDGMHWDVEAQIVDEDGIASATLYYRTEGASYWETLQLDSIGTDQWQTTIPAVSVPGVEFYIKAEDLGSPIATTLYPTGGPSAPQQMTVFPASRSLPFYEGFELGMGQITLLDMDWWTPSETRDTYHWMLNESRAYSGDYSVNHFRGSDGMPELRDWLISPPLDFSAESQIMVGWWEYGLAVENMEEHSLWVSTGERHPDAGDYQPVEFLNAPDSAQWMRHRYIDLSAYAGEPIVYLGWRWVGSNSDEWSIDDVEVRRLAPDLALSVSTPTVQPGDPTNIAVELRNLTDGTAESCRTQISFSEGADPLEQELDGWSIEGLEVLEQDFTVTLDPTLPPHSRLPMSVLVECAEDSWTLDYRLQIGSASMAIAQFDLSTRSQVTAVIGVGDPTSPTWSEVFYDGILDAGVVNLTLDVTDQYAYLPPVAGPERWFLHVESSSTVVVQQFVISYGEQLVGINTSQVALADLPLDVQIPSPPSFEVISVTPNSVQPGQQNVNITIQVMNQGASTQGSVSASLVTSDPDVILNTTELGSLDGDLWTPYESHTFVASISVDPTHTDSTPITFDVLMADDVDTWIVPIQVEVPFARLGVVGIVVQDSTGNNDGILDPAETAQLEISIANSGGQSANGVVHGEISLEGTSTATADVVNDNPSFGFMNVGAQKDDNGFYVTVTSGNVGDSLNFLLTMDDNTSIFTDRFQITLGEAPWIGVSPLQDPEGDVLNPNDVDLKRVQYRVVGGTVEMLIESATTINPSTAFIEAWGRSGGAGYSYFRWVVQSGVGTLQGYISGVGFQPLGPLSVAYPDGNHMLLSFDSSDLDLALNQFDIGFASGWCGPPNYYCDQYPNGWGYPYVSFSPGQWFTIEW